MAVSNDKLFTNCTPETCTVHKVSRCPSVHRICSILNQCSEIDVDKELNTEFLQMINDKYTVTDLLNDFHHIKADHNVDDDDQKFHEINQYLKQNMFVACNVKYCRYINIHYRDRSQVRNQYFLGHDENDVGATLNEQYTLDMISMIHTFFIHSYDIHRLTLKEQATLQGQMEMLNNCSLDDAENKMDDVEFLQEKKMEMITLFMKGKKKKIQGIKNNVKYIEARNDVVDATKQQIDFDVINKVLNENISVSKEDIVAVFAPYQNNKDKFIADLIDAFYTKKEGDLSGVNKLKDDANHRKTIYGQILYKYFKKMDLNNANFTKLATLIIMRLIPHINIELFTTIITDKNLHINGRMLIKGTDGFIKSTQFAQLFKQMPCFKKKQFAQIYVQINRWKPIETKVKAKIEEKKNDIEHDTKQEIDENDEIEIDNKQKEVYDLGTSYFYWDSHRYHANYIEANHDSLKNEILQNKFFNFSMKSWQELSAECRYMLSSNLAKTIAANGYYQHIYKIKEYSPFSIQHLLALKLYTDYTDLCSKICSTLRSGNELDVAEIAVWAKYLTECVQVFGSKLKYSKRKIYYRGVSAAMTFELFITRFNLPTSTTSDFVRAAEFGQYGIVLELNEYKDVLDVFMLNCSALSAFPQEKETLFFGRDTILRVSCIWQILEGKWKSYKKYIEPLSAIARMTSGLSISNHHIVSNRKKQNTMLELMNFIVHPSNLDTANLKSLPPYIQHSLKHQTCAASIHFNFNDIISEYTWLHSKFLKKTDTGSNPIIHISNMAVFFYQSEQITFCMPDNYILSDAECQSLVQDLQSISNMCLEVIIQFKWNSNLLPQNRSNLNNCLQQMFAINWKRIFCRKSVTFECVKSSYTVKAQQMFQTAVKTIFFEPKALTKISNQKKKVPTNKIIAFHDSPGNMNIKVSKKDICRQHIRLVDGYIGRIKRLAPVEVVDIIIFFYAKRLVIDLKYNGKVDFVLLCPIADVWQSLKKGVAKKFETLDLRSLTDKTNRKINGSNYLNKEFCLFEHTLYNITGRTTNTYGTSRHITSGVRIRSLSIRNMGPKVNSKDISM
eukprot:495022_1